MSIIIIGLAGRKRSGKDTAAKALIARGFKKLSFAQPLKEICASMTGLPFEHFDKDILKDANLFEPILLKGGEINRLLEGLHELAPLNRELAGSIMMRCTDMIFHTPRELMQFIGTDIVRDIISREYWTNTMRSKLRVANKVVITDMRFLEERQLLKSFGAKLVLINRIQEATERSGHASENSLGNNEDYDTILFNDQGIKDLQNNLLRSIGV